MSNLQPSLFDGEAKNNHRNEQSLLALSRLPGVGFGTVRHLFHALGGDLFRVWSLPLEDVCEHLKAARTPQPQAVAQQIRDRDQARTLLAEARDEYENRLRDRVSLIFQGTPQYPHALNNLPSPPAWLFVQGNPQALQDPSIVAVVGTREPTEAGLECARRLTVLLVREGCAILSGLAEGIDVVGHRTALHWGAPTIAVLGHGIDVVFPASTAGVRRQIVERGGAVVSEYLPNDNYARDRFVARNRIQAALSKVVVVVEGQSKSGTAHTVRFALQLTRRLMGARLGPPSGSPQQELLQDLAAAEHPVFDLDRQADRDALRRFLRASLPPERRKRKSASPFLFRGVLDEMRQQADWYGATKADFDFFIAEVRKIQRTSLAEPDDDQEKNPDAD